MELSENKTLVRRYYEEIVNTGDVSRLAEFIDPGYAEVHGNQPRQVGIEGARQHVLGVRETYPDLHLTIEQQIAEDDWVATRVTMRGTHSGVWLGMKPTGKTIQVSAVNLDRIRNGRIVEHGGAANLLLPLLDTGAIRVADPIRDAGRGS